MEMRDWNSTTYYFDISYALFIRQTFVSHYSITYLLYHLSKRATKPTKYCKTHYVIVNNDTQL